MLPCLIVDRSQDGFGLNVGCGLRQGQLVDLILDQDPSKPVRCSVVWIGEPGSKREGHTGLQTVSARSAEPESFLHSPFQSDLKIVFLVRAVNHIPIERLLQTVDGCGTRVARACCLLRGVYR